MKIIVTILLSLAVLLVACDDGLDSQRSATDKADERQESGLIYEPSNDVDFTNFNDWARQSDDPTTILWCTFFPPTVGQEPFTVPIIGKLTDSGKTPYPTKFNPDEIKGPAAELADPFSMYGVSSEFRYGFDPTRTVYSDFTALPSFCTTEPKVWQRNQTTIIVEPASDLVALHDQAREALADGRVDEARDILRRAESGQ